MKVTAQELAARLGSQPPTEEQVAVIEAAVDRPCLVVAGAGSGKTTTMANRVVWLVANGLAAPDQVLGLTFTRKAAGELSHKVRRALRLLALSGGSADGEVVVSTYNSYAARILTDHALRLAVEPSARLITPAVQWQLVTRVVEGYRGPMDEVDVTPSTVVDAVMSLSAELAEHLRSPDDVRAELARIEEAFAAVPKAGVAQKEILAAQRKRAQLLPLVEAYSQAKRVQGLIDYGDQVALAAELARDHAVVGASERSRFPFVLLDEYQDTGHAQSVLLGNLFGAGHPVMAVGDPCQSIYGWRGASAGNLDRFPSVFARPGEEREVVRLHLRTSFRNGAAILDVANCVSEELRGSGIDVPTLVSSPYRADPGSVHACLHGSAEHEAAAVADRVAHLHGCGELEGLGRPLQWSDVAVLARKRSQFPLLIKAFRDRDIPVEVVGLGGLLSAPEVTDVLAVLRVLHDPQANSAVLRLLTGARWQLGPRDLSALGRRSSWLAANGRRDLAIDDEPVLVDDERPADTTDSADQGDIEFDDPVARAVAGLDPVEGGSLADAVDDLGDPAAYSELGYLRLAALRDELRALRRRTWQALPDLIAEVERRLGLDVEVASLPGVDAVAARANLDAFLDAAADFAQDDEQPTLGAFLSYLAAAEEKEFGLEEGRVGSSDSVKLMTAHAAKGLEWPVVFVPGLSSGSKSAVFPTTPRNSLAWAKQIAMIPYPLRGDHAKLPTLASLESEAIKVFKADLATTHELDERRLAYVALTRASHLLVCSGYWKGAGKTPLGPSVFLREVREALGATGEHDEWLEEPPEAEDPGAVAADAVCWPPERHVGADLRRAAEWVTAAREALAGTGDQLVLLDVEPADDLASSHCEGDSARVSAWDRDLDLLLTESAAPPKSARAVELPSHLSVSTLVALAKDPQRLAASLRRPMPRKPAPLARRGTAFHLWVEQLYGLPQLLDLEELPGSADADASPDADLDLLKAAFQSSEWWGRAPVPDGVEVPFEMAVEGVLVRGRMDAVFEVDGRAVVVDWKTGAVPSGDEAKAAAVQLATYRLAWSHLTGTPLEDVGAAFHYVRSGVTVTPVDLLDADGLRALVCSVPLAEEQLS